MKWIKTDTHFEYRQGDYAAIVKENGQGGCCFWIMLGERVMHARGQRHPGCDERVNLTQKQAKQQALKALSTFRIVNAK